MPMPPVSKKDARRIKRAMRQRRPCILCGATELLHQGLFFPDRPEAWGGKPGKGRAYVYCLCTPCKAVPNWTTRVEARIQADLVGRGN